MLTCIVGHPRTGTSALALHLAKTHTLITDDMPGWDHEKSTETHIFQRDDESEIREMLKKPNPLVKNPDNTFYIDRILAYSADTRFIAINRDKEEQIESFARAAKVTEDEARREWERYEREIDKHKDKIDFISIDEVREMTA